MNPLARTPRPHWVPSPILVVPLVLLLLLLLPPSATLAQAGRSRTVSRLYFEPHIPQTFDLTEYYLRRIGYNEGCFPGLESGTDSKIVLSADGSLSGDCIYETGSGDNFEKITGTLKGTVKENRISFTITTVRDYAVPIRITDRDHKEIGSYIGRGHIELSYQANGTFTAPSQATGEASFSYSCSAQQTNLQGEVRSGVENECPGSKADPLQVSRSDSGSMSGKTTFLIEFENAPSRLPLIFVPGVGGSMLELEGTSLHRDLWPTALVASRTNLMLEADGFTPAVKGATILARDIIRSDDVYNPILNALAEQGYEEGTDLFIFPYDWRLDNSRQVSALSKKVEEVLKETGSAQVNILTHSMGGLIARAYVNSSAAGKVNTLITLSLPMYGSPKALYGLVSGYTFGNWTVRQPLMKLLMQNWPSTYQLVARKPFIVDDSTGQPLPLEAWHRLRYRGFVGVIEDYVGRDIYTETKDNIWSPNPTLVQAADAFYRMLVDPATGQEKPLPSGVKHYAIFGYGVRTLAFWRLKDWTQRVQSSWNPLPSFSADTYLELDGRKVILEPVFLEGDGTVPLWGLNLTSVTNKYLFPYVDKAHSSEHTAITAYPEVHELLQALYEGEEPIQEYLPVPAERLDPNRWLYFFEGTDFTLRSDAHLTILDERTGAQLGFNDAGEIEESITSGSFIYTQGAEYASIADVQGSYRVQVKGFQDGSFHLTVTAAQGGQTTTFTYGPVPVKNGTLAEVRIAPQQLDPNLPPLEVTTDGNKSTVPAHVGPVVLQPSASDISSLPSTPPPDSPPLAPAGNSTAAPTTAASNLAVIATCLTTLTGVAFLGIIIVTRRQSRRPIAPSSGPIPAPSRLA